MTWNKPSLADIACAYEKGATAPVSVKECIKKEMQEKAKGGAYYGQKKRHESTYDGGMFKSSDENENIRYSQTRRKENGRI